MNAWTSPLIIEVLEELHSNPAFIVVFFFLCSQSSMYFKRARKNPEIPRIKPTNPKKSIQIPIKKGLRSHLGDLYGPGAVRVDVQPVDAG